MRSTKKKIKISEFIREFGKTIRLPKRKPRTPVILAIAGPSRVGKTTTLEFIREKLPYFVRIARDDMRLFLYENGFDVKSTEKYLYRSSPSFKLARIFLKKGYSVMLDYNFASRPRQSEPLVRFAEQSKTDFFLLRAWGPPQAIRRRLRGKTSKLFPDWRVGIDHFERSRKQFNYKKLKRLYLAEVNTTRPLAPQLKGAIASLRSAMSI